ncbi:MAG: RNA-binding protein [Phycisphaerales bacterium]|nr:RNA-binding protein [Phycisphaerales bacterium]
MKIYVGNLPFNMSQSEVEDAFSEFGQVAECTLIMDRDTGRPKGFGFVEMPDKSEALNAMQALDGKEFNGRNIKVNEAKPREPRSGGGGYGGGGGGRGGYGGGGGRGGRDRY